MKKRDIILLIGLASFVIFVISLTLLLGEKFEVKSCGCPKMVSNNFVYLFIILSIIFVASLVYYLFSLKIDAKEKVINKNIELLYKILDKDEKKVLDKIIKQKGQIEQSKISEELGKLKVHRTLKKLEQKGIITIEKKGRTNIIKLNEELKQELI